MKPASRQGTAPIDRIPVTLTVTYLLVSVIWIWWSDYLLYLWVHDATLLHTLSIAKGWFFVAVTGTLLFFLLRRMLARSARYERALRESEGRLRTIIGSMDELIVIVDGDLRITSLYGPLASMFGIEPEKVVGQRVADLQLPDMARMVTQVLHRVRRGETVVEELTVPLSDRTVILEVSFSPLGRAAEEGAMLGVCRDVSRLRQAEREQRRYAAMVSAIFEASPLPIYAVDPGTNVLVWNPAAERMFGWTEAEVVGQPIPYLPHEARVESATIRQRALTGETFTVEPVRRLRRDGSLVELSMSLAPLRDTGGRVTGIMTIASDISEVRQTARMLERYQMLVTHTNEVVLFVNPHSGAIMEANEAAATAYGYSRAELLQLKIASLRASGTEGLIAGQINQAWKTGITFETRHVRRDGSDFPVEVHSVGAYVGGEPTLLSLIRDISDRKRSEELDRLLREVDGQILEYQPLERVCGHLCDGLKGILRCRAAWVEAATGPDEGAALVWLAGDPVPAAADLPPVGESHLVLSLTMDGPAMLLHLLAQDGNDFPEAVVQETEGLTRNLVGSIHAARFLGQLRLRQAALEAAANAVVIADRQGRVSWVNPAFVRLTGYSLEDMRGQNPRMLRSGIHPTGFFASLWETINKGLVWQGEIFNRKKDGSIYVAEQTITPVVNAQGEVTHFVGISQDITGRKQSEQQLRYLSAYDPLTGLPNRRTMETDLKLAVDRAERGRPGLLLMLDMDHFKLINDSMGHAVGDQVLFQVARRLGEMVRSGDLVARLGDDEFAILAESIPPDDAGRWAEQLRVGVEASELSVPGLVADPAVSIGAVIIDGTKNGEELLAEAAAALHEAKRRGRNRVVMASELAGRSEHVSDHTHWATHIRSALRNNGFVLHYQPLVRLSTGVVEHAEALIRMQQSDGSLVLPGTFLPVAEQFRLMPQIDRWVVRQALDHLRANAKLRLFVNLSGESLSSLSLLEDIEGWVRSAGLQVGTRLTLEVTETAAVRDLMGARQWMERLTELGCRFALDDFGRGFSSFTYLNALPAHFIKLDGSYVASLEADAKNRALVESITRVAHTLGKEVVAEWVETPEIGRILAEMGVEYGQGYGLGRPSPTWAPELGE